MRLRALTDRPALALLLGSLLAPLAAADLYMTPAGAGARNGASWADALSYDADPNSLQAAWDQLKPGETCHLGAGEYAARTLTLKSEGASDAAGTRTLRGEIQDGKRPVFVGSWVKEDPAKGQAVIAIAPGSTWWAIEHIGVRDCRSAVETVAPGRVAHGRIVDLAMEGVRDGVIILGGASATQPELGSHDIAIRDCSAVHYTKRGYRFRDGCYDIRLERCLADAGGKAWATEAFHMGFGITGGGKDSGVADHDFTFTDCVSRNNYWDAGPDKYWQGDGFCAEGSVYNLTFIGCAAYDNGDGGWDLKSPNPLFIGCVGLRNKKNYRCWSDAPGAVLVRCLGAYAVLRGGNSEATGLWVGGKVRAIQCSFIENDHSIVMNDALHPTPEQRARMGLELKDCLVTLPEEQQQALAAFPGVDFGASLVWRPHSQAGEALGFSGSAEAKALPEAGTAFDSLTQGPAKGYHSSWRQADLLAGARALQPLLPTSGKRLPAAPILLFQGKHPDGWYASAWKDAAIADAKGEGREGRDALAITATGAGGAGYQTKTAGSVISLADREPAAWELCFGIRLGTLKPGELKVRAISGDHDLATREIDLAGQSAAGGWTEVRLPLTAFLAAADAGFASFAGFSIRVPGKLDAPILIDQIRLEPAARH